METANKRPRPERDHTDDSLRFERDKADEEFSQRRLAIEEDADAVVERARQDADHVLQVARERADEKLQENRVPARALEITQAERDQEDRALASERTTADQQLHGEREDRKRALARLLRFERETTDKHLLCERARSDNAVTSRDDFLAMVSHDLRTLLGGVAMTAAMLARGASNDEVGRRARGEAERIQRFTARMNRLIGDLIDIASIEAGKLNVAVKRDDAALLLRDCTEAFLMPASAKCISVTSKVVGESLLARFDYERILQVLANLMSNAIKFTDEGGAITMQVEPDGAEVRFSVADSGSGIAADKLEAIFERFWQVNQTDRRGLGLGLYISKCIVEAHGGRIWVESRPGGGSTFYFTLPSAGPWEPSGSGPGAVGERS